MHAPQHTQHAHALTPGWRADARAPLLHIRTDLSPATSRPSSPGSHDGRHAATSPFSALRRDPAASANPAAIRLSFAVHRDAELTPPHPSHPAAVSQPPLAAFGPANGHLDAWPPAPPDTHVTAAQMRRRRAPSLTLQRFTSEPGPAELPPQRISRSFGRLLAAPNHLHARPGRHSAGTASPDSPQQSCHTRSHSAHSIHSAHSSPLKGVADFRAMLISDLSTPQVGSPAVPSRGLSPHGPRRSLSGIPPHALAPPAPVAAGAPSAPYEPSLPLAPCRSLPAIGHPDFAQRRDTSAYASRVAASASIVAQDDRTALSVTFPTPQRSAHVTEEEHRLPENLDSAAPEAPTENVALRGLGQLGTALAEGAPATQGGMPHAQSEHTGLDAAKVRAACNGAAASPATGQLKLADVAAFAIGRRSPTSMPANEVDMDAQPGGSGGPAGVGGTAGSAPVPIPTSTPQAFGGTVFLRTSPAHSTGYRPDEGPPPNGAAAPPPAAPRPWQPPSFNRSSFGVGRLSLGDRANTLTEPKSLLIFPDTPEGHYAQITCATLARKFVAPRTQSTQHAQHTTIAASRVWITGGCRRDSVSAVCVRCMFQRKWPAASSHRSVLRAARRSSSAFAADQLCTDCTGTSQLHRASRVKRPHAMKH